MPAVLQIAHSAGTAPPETAVPPGATDAHIHVYDGRFPVAAGATLLPPDATVEQYRALQRRLGTSRVVLVQPSTYGTDNRCMLDAVAGFGTAVARAVAVVDASVTDTELRRLDGLGVRAVRFNLAAQGGPAGIARLGPLSERIADLGWHVHVHMTADQIAESHDPLSRIATPVLFDHLGRIPPESGVRHPGFAVIRALLDGGRAWLKLSAAYQDSRVGAPGFDDVAPVARAFVAAAPERLVWGSDWPHPTLPAAAKPDDAVLFDLLADWAPDPATRRRILVDNPATLFGFCRVA